MSNPVSASSYLGRAKELLASKDKASLFYAALELRCGIEARMQEHLSVAHGVSKGQVDQWEIKKLGRSIDSAFGLGDSMLIVFLNMADGRSCQFIYVPVSSRLQGIGKRCGDYLHAVPQERLAAAEFWTDFRSLVSEGCTLLEVACSSEILRPSADAGFHFSLAPGDPRASIIQDLVQGAPGTFSTAKLTPAGPVTVYPADDA